MEKDNKSTKTEQCTIPSVVLSALRLNFNKLIGSDFNDELKLIALDWMLKTGRKHKQQYGRWNVIGISQLLFNYSGNESYSCSISLPKKTSEWNMYFDAIFGRAIYQLPNKAVTEWRNEERIFTDKYRILKVNKNIPKNYLDRHKHISWLISNIYDFENSLLIKKYAHFEYKDRIKPKIIKIEIYTTGNGWVVKYHFSFKNFKYENGWSFKYTQKNNQSLWEFLGETYDDIQMRVVRI